MTHEGRTTQASSADSGDAIMTKEQERPLSVGLRAARANLVPALVIQAAVVTVVLAYYFWEPARVWLGRLAEFKREGGYLFSLVAGVLTGGLLPELLTVAVFQRWRVRRENLSSLAFGACFWGLMALVVDLFYHLQALMFGSGVEFATVFKKTVIDQFVFTPFVTIPLTVVVFEWRHAGYRLGAVSRALGRGFYMQKVLPAVVSGLGFWLPVVVFVYSLPLPLQFPLFTLALTLWVMIFTWISHANKAAP
ncbi:MAG: hypothetical protein QOH49_4077 [Acidobacteriota bacterium]|jgi:hypothetical protein|nr:hypothetical protein [Acidobacteriota bacterium]